MDRKVSCNDSRYMEMLLFITCLSKFSYSYFSEEDKEEILNHYIHMVSCNVCRVGYESFKEIKRLEFKHCGSDFELLAKNEDQLAKVILPSLNSLTDRINFINYQNLQKN